MIAMLTTYAMAALLVAAIVIEMKSGRIPNWLTLIPPALFVVWAFFAPDWSTVLWQLGLAAVVFGLGVILFVFAGFGAGAVKLMGGATLFIPLSNAFGALIVFVLTLLFGGVLVIMIRKWFGSEDSAWNVMAKPVLRMS